MRKPAKRLLGIWLVESLIVSAVLGLIAGIPVASLLKIQVMQGILGTSLILFLIMAAYTFERYRSWGFQIKDDHLYLQHGVFKKVRSMVPFVRIQHVDSQRSFVERLAGLSRVVVYTAGSRGADVTLPGLDPGEAEEMQERLRDVAIASEDRDAV